MVRYPSPSLKASEFPAHVMKKSFLCCVYDAVTLQVIKWYDLVVAEDCSYARHGVARQFENDHRELADKFHHTWKVDSVEI